MVRDHGNPRIVAVAAALFVASMTACGSDELSVSLSEVRDSAGITIVESSGANPLPWSVGSTPRVSIGAVDGPQEYQLFVVADATRLGDGRILVANAGTAELRVFADDGTYIETWGREGEGPGEFQTLRAVSVWAPDSVLTFDPRLRRLDVRGPGGELGRTFALPTDGTSVRLYFGEVLPGGTILATGSTGFALGQAESGLQRTTEEYATVDAEGALLTHFGTFRGSEEFVVSTEQFLSARPHPFGRSTVSAGWGDLVILGTNETFELRAYNGDGTLARIVRMAHELVVPTQSELDEWVRGRIASRTGRARETEERVLEGIPLNDAKPAFGRLIVDSTERIWVSDFVVDEPAPTRWTVFGPEGRVAGTIDTPAGLQIYEIGADYILGRVRDDFDVEYVQVWPLERGGSGQQ